MSFSLCLPQALGTFPTLAIHAAWEAARGFGRPLPQPLLCSSSLLGSDPGLQASAGSASKLGESARPDTSAYFRLLLSELPAAKNPSGTTVSAS